MSLPRDPTTGLNILEQACVHGDVDVVQQILRDPHVDPMEFSPYEDMNALMYACSEGHVNVVDLLLRDLRVDPLRISPRYRFTALIVAIRVSHLAVVTRLLEDDRIDRETLPVLTTLRICLTESNEDEIQNDLIIFDLLMRSSLNINMNAILDMITDDYKANEQSLLVLAQVLLDDRVDPWHNHGAILQLILEHVNNPYAWSVFIRWMSHPQTLPRWEEEIEDVRISRRDRKVLADWVYLWNHQVKEALERHVYDDLSRQIMGYVVPQAKMKKK